MKLYKNVDLCDLDSILEKGLLSANAAKNYNWDNGKRSNNSYDVVYLFSPLGKVNSFPKYGVVLLEVDVDAAENEILPYDSHYGDYTEYVCDYIAPEQIKAVYIPRIFRERISNDFLSSDKIKWVEIEAYCYSEESHGKVLATPDILDVFASTAYIEASNEFNYFRGERPDRTMIDLYDVKYIKEEK